MHTVEKWDEEINQCVQDKKQSLNVVLLRQWKFFLMGI
jgi:hypothetical protein